MSKQILSAGQTWGTTRTKINTNINELYNSVGVNLSQYNNDLPTAIAAVGSTTPTTLTISTQPNDITADLTIPSNITLDWKAGCVLDGAFTLTLNCIIQAGPYQIFGSMLTVNGSPITEYIWPYWWTENVEPGTTNVTGALNLSIAMANTGSSCKTVKLLAGKHFFDGTVTLYSSIKIIGQSDIDTVGTVLEFNDVSGIPAFDSPDNYLSGFHMEQIQIINVLNVAGTSGSGNCFELKSLTNNSSFKRIEVRNFKADAFNVSRQSINSTDYTVCGNVTFEQVFVISCGGWAFNIDGYVNATWLMCNFNSPVSGAFKFTDGSSNQSIINILGLWFEGNKTWSGSTIAEMNSTNNQTINFFGCTFSNVQGEVRASGSKGDVVKISGTAARPSFINCIGYGYDNAINDTFNSTTFTFTSPLNYNSANNTGQSYVRGSNPVMDIFDTDGATTNQRRFKWHISGNLLVLSKLTDVGVSDGAIVQYQHNTKQARFQGPIGVGNTTENTNTPSGATIKQWPILDSNGTLIGYVPIYENAW